MAEGIESTPGRPVGPQRMGTDDTSGTPVALIEVARRRGKLWGLTAVDEGDVLVEFPVGRQSRQSTGYDRFVQLRSGGYALVTPTNA